MVLCLCESRFPVKMAGPGILLGGYLHILGPPVFNPVALYGYLLSDMYLFVAYITNPDSFV